MKYFFKKTIYLLLPRFTRTRLYWLYSTLRYFVRNKMLVPRTELEYNVAFMFRNYWENLRDKQSEVMEKLNDKLDKDSQKLTKQVLERHIYMTENNILVQNALYSKEELAEQKICSKEVRNLSIKMWRYYFPTLLGAECFYGYSGLRWLSKKQTAKIKDGVFLDAGACTGDTSIFLSDKFSPIHTYAFEPESRNYSYLVDNITKSKHKNIEPVKAGLSDKPKTAYISQAYGGSHLTEGTGEEVKLLTIDDFLEERKVSQRVTLIKMDIEGAEQSALVGAQKTILKDKPILAISIYHNPSDFFTIKPWIQNLCPEYKFIIRKATPFSLTGEVMLLAYID